MKLSYLRVSLNLSNIVSIEGDSKLVEEIQAAIDCLRNLLVVGGSSHLEFGTPCFKIQVRRYTWDQVSRKRKRDDGAKAGGSSLKYPTGLSVSDPWVHLS